jgi:DNA-3-methyladenine glycosylase II
MPVSVGAAVAHLRAADPVLAGMLDDVGGAPPVWEPSGDPYGAIIRAIVSQQLSVGAARAIHGRLLARFDGREPTPDEILADDPEGLKSVGLSRAKVVSLRSLATCIDDGELDLGALDAFDDEALIARLTVVKGIGEWTAQVLLVTELARPDVLVAGDLVIRRAVERGWSLAALPTREQLYALAEPWRPFRSTACALLWAWMRTAPTA